MVENNFLPIDELGLPAKELAFLQRCRVGQGRWDGDVLEIIAFPG